MSQKPRILCLHGGGVSAHIFGLQCRCFIKSLEPYFHLVFADGPYLSEMHEDLKQVYGGQGPCYRWSNWLPNHPPHDSDSAIEEIEYNLTKAMEADRGTGEWVGLLGFSQGAKLAVSILLENQLRLKQDPSATGFAGALWKFGIIMAGRAPPYSLSDRTLFNEYYTRLGELPGDYAYDAFRPQDRLRTPTLHVHGLGDPGLDLHRDLQRYFCDSESTVLVEWGAGHRIPFKSADVKLVTDGILNVAKAGGAIP